MGSNIGKDHELISMVTQVVKEVARVPVWAKLTPSTTDIVVEARGAFLGGADAISSSNTFPSLPLIDPQTLEFEVNVDGYVSSGGLGGPAILPLSLAKMSQLTQAFPDKSFSGIGGIAELRARAQLLPARLRHRAGVHGRDARPRDRAERDPAADRGTGRLPRAAWPTAGRRWTSFRGLRRDRVVAHSQIRRPDEKEYHGGDAAEGYASSETRPRCRRRGPDA